MIGGYVQDKIASGGLINDITYATGPLPPKTASFDC